MVAIYRWRGSSTLDLETIVKPRKDLSKLEVFLASYFQETFSSPYVYVGANPEAEGKLSPSEGRCKPGFLMAGKSFGDWQMFPRDQEALRVVHDGRWQKEPHPVEWTIMPHIGMPIGLRHSAKAGPTVVLMAPLDDCFAMRLLNRKPKALSGGQRQRVAVGRAIVRNPRAFLFDEPLSNLDAKLRISTRSELKALHHKLGATSIYVTHDQVEAMTLGDRICVMYNGAVQQVAGPTEVYERPVNRFVAGFLGTPPMNFFTGSVKFENDTACFVVGNDTVILPQRLRTALADYRDKEMVLGVRPQNLSFQQFPGQTANTISATVSAVEPLSVRTDVCLTNDTGQRFIANIEPHIKLNVNDVVKVHIDADKTHVFEPGETGKSIAYS